MVSQGRYEGNREARETEYEVKGIDLEEANVMKVCMDVKLVRDEVCIFGQTHLYYTSKLTTSCIELVTCNELIIVLYLILV